MRIGVITSLLLVGTACIPDADLFQDSDVSETDVAADTNPSDTSDTVDTATSNVPVAVCSATPIDGSLDALTPAQLFGGDSYDPRGHPITNYAWSLTAPANSHVGLANGPDVSARNFTADVLGEYVASLTVVTDDGRSSEPCTLTLHLDPPPTGLYVQLTWAHSGDDLDLHLLAQGGTPASATLDCYYAHRAPNWGADGAEDDPVMVSDDIPGTGPEVIVYANPAASLYTVVVHDYPGSVNNTPNDAVIVIALDGEITTLTRTLSIEGTYYYIAAIDRVAHTVTACPDEGC